MNITSGDIVTFEARGRTHEGTVIQTRIMHRRKVAQFEGMIGVDRQYSAAHTLVAEVSVLNEGIWTIPVHKCTAKAKAAPEQMDQAWNQKETITTSRRNAQAARKSHRFDAAKTNGLLNLIPNQRIEIKLHHGWESGFFLGWTTTGKVIFRDRHNRKGRVGPIYVRLYQAKEEDAIQVI